nr:glutathione peroxidase [uncultured Lachnoanaerobaculum sp.]
MNIYDFKVKNNKGEEVSLSDYKNKVVLIINSATECGFTPQYEQLQKLYADYQDKDFVILDFPCDQFGHQAPGSDEEIAKFCSSRFGVTFPLFSKIEVNGDGACEVFKYLKSEKGFAGWGADNDMSKLLTKMLGEADPDYASKPDIKWNFTKFLIDKNGNVVRRFEPTEGVEVVEEAVKKLI